jgi:hypothetical protein
LQFEDSELKCQWPAVIFLMNIPSPTEFTIAKQLLIFANRKKQKTPPGGGIHVSLAME